MRNSNWVAFENALNEAKEPMEKQGWRYKSFCFKKKDERIYIAWTPCPSGRCLVYRMKGPERTSPVRDIPLGWLAEGRLWALV